jgi:putative DNA primase/helicase
VTPEQFVNAVVAKTGGRQSNGLCRCPCHDDSTASLSITVKNGKALFNCFADCTQDDLIAKWREWGLWGSLARPPSSDAGSESNTSKDEDDAKRTAAAKVIWDNTTRTKQDREKLGRYFREARGVSVPSGARYMFSNFTESRELTYNDKPILRDDEEAIVLKIINAKTAQFQGCQLTFIDPVRCINVRNDQGKSKRWVLGPLKGGMIDVGGFLLPGKCEGVVIVAEGVEKVQAALMIVAGRGLNVGGAVSAINNTNMANVVAALRERCREIILAADNDEQGRKAAEKAARAAGGACPVRIACPPDPHKDWDGALKAGLAIEELKQIFQRAERVTVLEDQGDKDNSGEPNKFKDKAEQDEFIAELAKLDLVEYDRRRTTAAAELKIRAATLDVMVKALRPVVTANPKLSFLQPVQPWPKPVNGQELIEAVLNRIDRHVILPKYGLTATTLWVGHAHAHDAADHSPFLAIESPTPRCGKTTLLTTVGRLVPKPLASANVTPATIFRVIDRYYPTMLIDEADTIPMYELRGILNSGHERRQAFTTRCVGDNHEPTPFSTWAPKAIALIGRLHPTLEDRAIIIEMKRRLPNETVERLPRSDNAFEELRRKLARWVEDNADRLKSADPQMPEALHDRARDSWRPLFAIADEIGGQWPDNARLAAAKLSTVSDDNEVNAIQLLRDLKRLFDEEDTDKGGIMSSAYIVDALNRMDDRPWAEFDDKGKPFTPSAMAKLLKGFKIKPRQVRVRGIQVQGYREEQFRYVFERYIGVPPSEMSDTTDNRSKSGG